MKRQLDLTGLSDVGGDFATIVSDAELLATIVNIGQPAAQKMLTEFGSLGELIAAPLARLAENGIDRDAIRKLKAMHHAIVRVLRGEVKKRPVLANWATVLDYLRSVLAFESIEHCRVLYLNKRNGLIADEQTGYGTVDHTPVYPREVIKRALELNATAIILAHNHPSGDPTPSRADIQMTQAIIEMGKPFGIAVHDHVIVGTDGHASLKGLKLI